MVLESGFLREKRGIGRSEEKGALRPVIVRKPEEGFLLKSLLMTTAAIEGVLEWGDGFL